MKKLSKINIIILLCVLISGTTGQHAAGKTLPKAGEAKPSAVQSQDADALKKGCELTVHIKGAHAEGDFKILIKDFANTDIERVILIIHGAAASSQIENNNDADGGRIIYYKYKESTDRPIKTATYHLFNAFRRIKSLKNGQMEKEKFLKYDFTYYELINAVEKLVYKDEIKLAGDTISVKKRVFKELPATMFYMQQSHPGKFD